MRVSATLVRTLRIRFAFSTSWTWASGACFFSARPAASRWPVSERSLLSSPTLRMIVPASSERG